MQVCQNDGEGPQGAECVGPMSIYAGGVFVAQPINLTTAHVAKIKAAAPGAAVLAYWCFDCIPIKPADAAECPCCTGHM